MTSLGAAIFLGACGLIVVARVVTAYRRLQRTYDLIKRLDKKHF